jgi:hypothetical protein
MNLSTLKSLQKRIQEATGPDRELDCLIRAVFDGHTVREDGNNILARSTRPPHDECLIGRIDPGKRQRNFTEAWRDPPAPNFTTDPDGLGACVALFHEVLTGCKWTRTASGRFRVWDWNDLLASDAKPLANDCLTFLDAIFSAKIAELEAEQEKEKADV